MENKGLLNEKYIVANKLPIKSKFNAEPGVYFLIKEESIIYIGKTNNMSKRLSNHEKLKFCDSVFFLETSDTEVASLEAEYILKYKPEHNIRLVDIMTPITISVLVETKLLYDKLKKEGFILSNEVDKLIKEKAKVKLKKNGI